MSSTQQHEATKTPDNAAAAVEGTTHDNAAKMSAVNELLGVAVEEPAKPEKVAPQADAEKTVSESLAEAEKPSDGGESPKTIAPPKTLLELSEMTGIKVDDLYSLEIPASEDGGESSTLGSLKDDAAKKVDFAGRELQFEERRVSFGNEQAKARQELEVILKSLPDGAIKPEIMDRARRERELMIDLEAERVVDVIPEWNDEDVQRRERAEIGEHMEQYGFERGHINQLFDHRMLRYMRDNFRRMQLVERALAGVKPVKLVPKSTTTQPTKRVIKTEVTPASSQDDKLAAIDSLLKPG